MRLHHLSMTAFGPFADTVEVDFDSLSAAGLFLLTGATGAGKTSVLDAVCFALYGQVPGDRSGAKHFRSDHAPAGRAPEVVLDVSIGERRFRFTRSPAWVRPKRRGSGETKVQAHVLVEELGSHGWTAMTNRLDEAGHLVTELLGMNAGQFTQVAMLPQGRFQAFLRATSAERHAVLQQLFRTDRFERVEKWLVERRSQARRAGEAGATATRTVLHRIEEASGTPLPEELDTELAQHAESGDVQAWAEQVLDVALAARDAAQAACAAAEAGEARAAQELADGRARRSLVDRARHAVAEQALLAEQRPEHDRLRTRLVQHRKAAPVSALADRRAATAAAAATAADRWSEQQRRLAELDPELGRDGVDPDLLVAAQRAARDAHAEARAFLPRERELTELLGRIERLRAEREAGAAELAELASTLADLPAQVAAADARREAAANAANLVAGARAEVVRLEGLTAAADRSVDVAAALVEARADLLAATTAALAAREVYLDVREARINGMAAELAGALASGCTCPVCGSAQHPSPARSTAGSVRRSDEDAARRAHEDAAFTEQGLQVLVATLESDLAALRAQLGTADPAALPRLLDEARAAHAALVAQAALVDATVQEATQIRDSLAAATQRAQDLHVRDATIETEHAELLATVESVEAARAALLGAAAETVAELVDLRAAQVTTLDDAVAAWNAHDAAASTAASDDLALVAAARAAGFTTVDAALAALLDDTEAEAIEADLAAADARSLAAEQTLADPEVRAAAQASPPDVDALTASHEAAARTLRDQVVLADSTQARARRLTELAAHLEEVLASWAPLRARYRLTAELASLVEGRSVDNPLRMRLAAYVLSERLRQVVDAANERLARMTGQRYALEHTDDRGVGELRGGLSLRIRDDWNGVDRDPATLSGGETFVVSLALALGLADTVAHEAGGTDIDTLFIDEGFGSLDPDTLEDVMDTLDTLRDGGRVVGLVSHVPELRSRISTQLEVSKGRTGSTLRPLVVGG